MTTESKKQKLLRVDESTAKLLKGFNKSSMNAAVLFLWERVCSQQEEIKRWRVATGSRNPLQHLKKQNDSLGK